MGTGFQKTRKETDSELKELLEVMMMTMMSPMRKAHLRQLLWILLLLQGWPWRLFR